MGKCETATASIGFKILLSDLILQINENNFNLIKEILNDGFIEDNNGYFNEVYSKIINENELPDHYLIFKEYLTKEFTNNGSIIKSKDGDITPTICHGCLFHQHLLVPIKKILQTNRWGYDRYGVNGTSTPIDFDLSVDIEKYKEIEKIKIIFILCQSSG